MELMTKQGYKQTEVGLIPDDWEVDTLKNVLRVIGGGTFKSRDRVADGIKWLKIANVGIRRIKWNEIDYLPFHFTQEYKPFLLEESDIVMALTRPILRNKLKISRLKGTDVPCLLNQRVGKIEALEGFYIDWIYHVLQTYNAINGLLDSMAGTDPPNLSNKGIYNIQIPFPPTLTEQKAIATALSDVDALIASLEQTITKKKAIKQGAMQQLLTPPHKGGKRLPGFEGEWVEKTLGEFCKITTGKLDANAMVPDGDYRFYTCARKFYYIDRFAFDTEALLVSGNGANVGYIHYYQGKFNAYQRTYVLDEFSANIHFMKCLLDKYLSLRIESEKNDGNTPYIKMDTLTDMYLNLPINKKEQQAIAQILSDMDAEITQLETKKEKYQAIKQGMMQELLTGKTRLI